MRKTLVALLVAVSMLPVSAFAGQDEEGHQLTARPARIADALAAIDPGAEVELTLRDGSVVRGRLDHVGKHALYVVDPATGIITQVADRALSKLSWVSNPSMKTRIIVLSVAGALMVLLALSAR